MVYTYTPTYYTTLQDSITSLCKNILPFPFKKKRLPAIAAAEQRLSKQQSDNLKWQQESFHKILNLMGLYKEGILAESEVSDFRSRLLETLVSSPADHEHTSILRDKLIFLQELLYSKCISEEEYHSSKKPLLQMLAIQGAETDAKDVIVGSKKEKSDEKWCAIAFKDEEESFPSNERPCSKIKPKQTSAVKQIEGSPSIFSNRNETIKEENGESNLGSEICRPDEKKTASSRFSRNIMTLSTENPFWNTQSSGIESETNTVLMLESLPTEPMKVEKQNGESNRSKKPFRSLFQREQSDRQGDGHRTEPAETGRKEKTGKKQWGFDGFKKWKKSDSDNETAPLSLDEKSDGKTISGQIAADPVGEMGNSRCSIAKEKLNSERWASFDDDDENFQPNLFHQDHHPFPSKQVKHAPLKSDLVYTNSMDKGFKNISFL